MYICLCGNVNIYIYRCVCIHILATQACFIRFACFKWKYFSILPRTLCQLIQKRNEKKKWIYVFGNLKAKTIDISIIESLPSYETQHYLAVMMMMMISAQNPRISLSSRTVRRWKGGSPGCSSTAMSTTSGAFMPSWWLGCCCWW